MTGPSDLSRDRGFLLGDGLFETIRLYQGRPFRLGDHLARLERSATRIRIRMPSGLQGRVEGALAEARCVGDGSLRVTLTRGPGPGLLPPDPPVAPTLRVEVRPFEAGQGTPPEGSGTPGSAPPGSGPEQRGRDGSPGGHESGLEARILGRVDESALTAGMKGIGYLERITAVLMAREAGAHEALLRNGRGRVVTGSASNLFVVCQGDLQTPRVEDGILPGITRQVVLELAGELAMGVDLRAPEDDELMAADEIFLTSSLRELAPVVRVDDRTVGSGRPGPVFHALRRAFRDRVARELDLGGDPRAKAPGGPGDG